MRSTTRAPLLPPPKEMEKRCRSLCVIYEDSRGILLRPLLRETHREGWRTRIMCCGHGFVMTGDAHLLSSLTLNEVCSVNSAINTLCLNFGTLSQGRASDDVGQAGQRGQAVGHHRGGLNSPLPTRYPSDARDLSSVHASLLVPRDFRSGSISRCVSHVDATPRLGAIVQGGSRGTVSDGAYRQRPVAPAIEHNDPLTVVTIAGLIGTTVTGFFGMNLLAWADAPLLDRAVFFFAVLVPIVALTIMTVTRSRRLADLDKLSDERLTTREKWTSFRKIWHSTA